MLEAGDVTPDLKETAETCVNSAEPEGVRTVVFIVCNYAVDHTGNLLFEKVFWKGDSASKNLKSINSASLLGSPPYSAFSSAHHRRRVTLLPDSNAFIRLVQLTMDGDEGLRRSVPFRLEDCSMTEGIDAMPILWGNSTPSGYFAYRHLTAEGSELHVVPEFVVFNGSEHHSILVRQLSHQPFMLDPKKIAPIARDRNNSIVVQFEVPAIDGLTGPVQIDKVGLRIVVAKSKETGQALGSLAVQTVTGARDSRLVIKIGALNFRESENEGERSSGLFAHDFIRVRVRWSEMRVTLKDTEEASEKYEENRTAIRKYLKSHNVDSVELEKKLAEARHDYNVEVGKKQKSFPEVAQILLHRFTVDFQRIFKEEDQKVQGMGLPSSERAQFSVVVHNVRITDCSPNTESSVVFDSMSDKSFFDLCVRTRGPLHADLIRVDLFDLNLAYGDGKAEKIVVDTGEDFVWRLLDIANRTMLATADLAGVDLDLKWDDKGECDSDLSINCCCWQVLTLHCSPSLYPFLYPAGKFSVAVSDPRLKDADDLDLGAP
jgi:vacuolar protein sorting-associated protein 13A/C